MLNEKKSFEHPIIFIVGNSRSGTTMMSRILGNHPKIFKFLELHFFEELWTPHDKNKMISKSDAVSIAARLLCVQREDYVLQGDLKYFNEEAENIINAMGMDTFTTEQIFKTFLFYETFKNGKTIPCENTPRNVFYIAEILEFYPDARVVNMIRDPRDILLSQKKKWRRWNLAERGLPVKEVIRLFNNYHPITISKLWNSSISATEKYADNKRVLSLRYEDFIAEAEQNLNKICNFIGIDFNEHLLEVTQGGSSFAKDNSGQKGIRKDRVGRWQKGGLNSTEIYLCQSITSVFMEKHGYFPVTIQPNPIRLIYYFISFPLKIALAFFLNLKRMRNVIETIKRRLT